MGPVHERVPLSSIRPSGQNPRRDFGDIEALADAIRATGGEPVNPPVVVRDGNVRRIVDGERRYRALRRIYKGETDREVSVISYDDMGEASECVAMLATDDKRRLDDAERARGVQQMLVLGVDEERIERSSRATREQIAAARKVGGLAPEGEQPTLDQMLAASRLPEADAAAVMAAGSRWRFEEAEARERMRRADRAAKARRRVERAGCEVADEPPEGMRLAHTVSWCGEPSWYNQDIDAWAEAAADIGAAVVGDDCSVGFYAPPNVVICAARDGREPTPDDERLARHDAACLSLARRMAAFALTGSFDALAPEVADAARAAREAPLWADGLGVSEAWGDAARSLSPSRYEMTAALAGAANKVRMGFIHSWDRARMDAGDARRLLDAVDLFAVAGFEPDRSDDSEEAWLLALAQEAADAGEAS